MDRMTDERLAELNREIDGLSKEPDCADLLLEEELLQALKAERDAFRKYKHYHSQTELRKRISELDAMMQYYREGVNYEQAVAVVRMEAMRKGLSDD